MAEVFDCGIVRVDPGVVGGARDGNVGEAVVDERSRAVHVEIGDDPAGGDALALYEVTA